MNPQNLIRMGAVGVGLVAAHAGAQVAYIGSYGGPTIDIVDLSTQTVTGSFTTAGNAEGIAVSPDGSRVYYGGVGHVMVFDAGTTAMLADLTPGGSVGSPLAHPSGQVVYVGLGSGASIKVLDTGTNTFVDTIPMPTNTVYMAFSPDAGTLWTGNTNYGSGVFRLTPVDTATNTAGTPIVMPSAVAELAVSPDGSVVYVSGEPANKVYVVDTTTHAIVDQIDMPGGPRGIVFSADGSAAYVANYISGSIAVVDVATGTMTDEWDVGGLPFRVALSGDGQTAYVPNYGTDSVQVIDVATGAITGSIAVSSHPVTIEFAPDPAEPCAADLAEPFGVLNFFDVAGYISLYNAGDGGADLAAPFGTLNFFDVSAYIDAYNAGCP